MLWPQKNSYKEFGNEKKFLRLGNSPPPPPPITFLMVRPLMEAKNHIKNTLATAKRWPRPLNRGGR